MDKKPLEIHFKVIPHKEQRYPTCGDYWMDEDGVLQFRVSDLGNNMKELAVFIHELVESFLCSSRGISWDEIDAFDIAYEKDRPKGDLSEPGNSPRAPYNLEHRFAENLERMFIHEAGINWQNYNDQIDNL